jgi:hypothetical protein
MADHILTLNNDQERTLEDLAKRSEDPAVTVDTLLAALITQSLALPVKTLIAREANTVEKIYVTADTKTRDAILTAATNAKTIDATPIK